MNFTTKLLFLIPLFCFLPACKEKPVPPVLSTMAVTAVTTTGAISGGSITNEGGATVTARGICWGTSTDPAIDNNKTVESSGSLTFSSSLTNLLPNTLYYVRAYAINSAGPGYGASLSFTTLGNKPSVTKPWASNIDLTSAHLIGTINPNCFTTNVTFEFGPSTGYGKSLPAVENPLDGNASGLVSADVADLLPGTVYHLRIKAENTLGVSYSEDVTFSTLGNIPASVPAEATSLQYNSATINGTVNANYFASTVSFEYGTTTSYGNAVDAVPVSVTGHAPVSVKADISGLSKGITYHFRIRAENQIGISYSTDKTFTTLSPITDIDGNVYNIKGFGTQIWMTEDLRTTKYNNGTLIGTTTPPLKEIYYELTPKYQWAYDGNESNVPVYGRLYTWYAATDERKLCPTGWHLPTDDEWTILTDYLTAGGYGYGGSGSDIAKSLASTTLWNSDPTAGNAGNDLSSNNSSGFSAVPGGVRIDYPGTLVFTSIGYSCAWWSATGNLPSTAWQRILTFNSGEVSRTYYGGKNTGSSVRCIKD
jgi:uncharacterized protein (TIGR02145 family)